MAPEMVIKAVERGYRDGHITLSCGTSATPTNIIIDELSTASTYAPALAYASAARSFGDAARTASEAMQRMAAALNAFRRAHARTRRSKTEKNRRAIQAASRRRNR